VLLGHTEPVPGAPLVILGPGLADPRAVRAIVTTPVRAVWRREPRERPLPAEGWWEGAEEAP